LAPQGGIEPPTP